MANKKRRIFFSVRSLSLAIVVIVLIYLGQSVVTFAQKKNSLEDSKVIRSVLVVQEAMRQIYKEVNPAVVRIEVEDTVVNPFRNDPMFRWFFGIPDKREKTPQKRKSFVGSGFVLSSDGYIITNHHVIARKNSKKYVDKVRVKLISGKAYEAKIVGSDSASDIALLKVKPDKKLKHVYIGNSEEIEVGDFAIAIGNPFGLSSTFTMGVISSKGQNIESQDGIPRIQTDAPINPGNSGGPLLSIKGEVIGINQMIYTRSGGSLGIGFAIPINYAVTVIEKLKTGKAIKHGYIGLSVIASPTEDQLRELDLIGKTGLLIANVVLGSPAWKAGIRPYDFITHVEGKTARKFADLKGAVLQRGVGNRIGLKIVRNGKSKKLSIKIGEAKS